MNIAYKAFCRVYQFAFHMALPVLPYREPEIYKTIADTVSILKKQQITSVLLVTDQGLRKAGSTGNVHSGKL